MKAKSRRADLIIGIGWIAVVAAILFLSGCRKSMQTALLPAYGIAPAFNNGMGGTDLDDPIEAPLVGETLDGAQVVAADSRAKFGYALAERAGDGWAITVYDVKGGPKVVCRVAGASLSCEGSVGAPLATLPSLTMGTSFPVATSP